MTTQGFYTWSHTANSNGTIDNSINMAEGMAPSAVNDGVRAVMARAAEYRDDIAGAIVTTGTSTAYVVASYQVFDTRGHMSGQMIAFTPHATNTGSSCTLNVDGLGAKPLLSAPGVNLLAGTIIQGTPYVVTYNNTDDAFYLQSFFGNPYNIPLAAGMDYWGPTTPNSSFAFPTGQQISQTTYAALYAVFGANRYGTDAGGNFFLPDKSGRVSAAIDLTGLHLTSVSITSGFATGLGGKGGTETHALTTAEMPTHTHANTLTDTGHGHPGSTGATEGNNIGSSVPTTALIGQNTTGALNSQVLTIASNTTGISINNASQGSGSAHVIVQPTIMCNYIMRII